LPWAEILIHEKRNRFWISQVYISQTTDVLPDAANKLASLHQNPAINSAPQLLNLQQKKVPSNLISA
jgi:hypothetical protein